MYNKLYFKSKSKDKKKKVCTINYILNLKVKIKKNKKHKWNIICKKIKKKYICLLKIKKN